MLLKAKSAILIAHQCPTYQPDQPSVAHYANIAPGHFSELQSWLDDNAPHLDDIDPTLGDIPLETYRELYQLRRGLWAALTFVANVLGTDFPSDEDAHQFYSERFDREKRFKESWDAFLARQKAKTAKPVKR